MDDKEVNLLLCIWLSILLFVLLGAIYSVYRLGRKLERRDLTAALVTNIEQAYYTGLSDGQAMHCWKKQ